MSTIREEAEFIVGENRFNRDTYTEHYEIAYKQAKRVLLLEKCYKCQFKASVLYFRVSTIAVNAETSKRRLQLQRAADYLSDKAAELYKQAENL